MNDARLDWIMEDPLKKPQKREEKPAEERQKKLEKEGTAEIRYYFGKYEMEFLGKTPQGSLCKALAPFTSGNLTVELNEEFLANHRFLWKRKRSEKM